MEDDYKILAAVTVVGVRVDRLTNLINGRVSNVPEHIRSTIKGRMPSSLYPPDTRLIAVGHVYGNRHVPLDVQRKVTNYTNEIEHSGIEELERLLELDQHLWLYFYGFKRWET